MAKTKEFDIHRDNELIAAGTHFWCETCLVARPLDDQSPDQRYCLNCYDFLLKEAELLSPKQGRPEWIPQAGKPTQKTADVSGHPALIMAGINGRENRICQKSTQGRPRLDLPLQFIKELRGQGFGATEISRQLNDRGVKVSMRTLYRILSK